MNIKHVINTLLIMNNEFKKEYSIYEIRNIEVDEYEIIVTIINNGLKIFKHRNL